MCRGCKLMAVIQWRLVSSDEVGWAVGTAQISMCGLNFQVVDLCIVDKTLVV
jgi:hypothetical protein